MKRHHLLLSCWVLSLLACACHRDQARPADKDPPAVCALSLPQHLVHTTPDALPAQVWYDLLFKGYRDGIGNDPVDCSGEPIAWAPLPSSCVEGELPARETARKHDLTQAELIIRNAGGEYWFGWAPFITFDNGMSEGPLAIARLHRDKLEVRAIGNLRAFSKRARLEVRKLGKQHILVAEGESCDATQKTCARATRLMWLDRQHFRVRPLRSATVRSCLGPAWFPQSELLQTKLSKRWSRTLQRDVALAYQEDLIMVDEHITVNDRDSDAPSLPPRLFREAQAQIRLTLEAGEFLSEGQSLWNAIRVEDGSTEVDGVSSPAPPRASTASSWAEPRASASAPAQERASGASAPTQARVPTLSAPTEPRAPTLSAPTTPRAPTLSAPSTPRAPNVSATSQPRAPTVLHRP